MMSLEIFRVEIMTIIGIQLGAKGEDEACTTVSLTVLESYYVVMMLFLGVAEQLTTWRSTL